MNLFEQLTPIYERAIALVLQEEGPTPEIFDLSEKRRGRVLLDRLQGSRGGLRSARDDARPSPLPQILGSTQDSAPDPGSPPSAPGPLGPSNEPIFLLVASAFVGYKSPLTAYTGIFSAAKSPRAAPKGRTARKRKPRES